jgi:hypothetical protein
MERVIKCLIVIFFVTFFTGCSSSRDASYKERAGLMLLKPQEIGRNKPYKPSKLKQKIHKKSQKSLLKSSRKIK